MVLDEMENEITIEQIVSLMEDIVNSYHGDQPITNLEQLEFWLWVYNKEN